MQITLSGTSALQAYAARLERLAQTAPALMATALNEAGAGLRRETVRAEARQTGLSQKLLNRAQRPHPATVGRMTYEVEASGGNIGLKFFGAREAGSGVVARPWGVQHEYQGAFIKGGRPGARVDIPSLHGQVFQRVGGSRLPIEKKRSDLYIPNEMVTGATKHVFEAYAPVAADIVLRRVIAVIA